MRGETKMASRTAMNEMSADMVASPAMFEVNALDVKNYFESVIKTRPLAEHENNLRNLSLVASELKVEKFLSYNKDPGLVETQNISIAIVNKMHEHPQWDVALGSPSLTKINTHIDLLKNTFGEKSYGWAWFLKQNGKTAEAKKILSEAYDVGFQNIMAMKMLHFDGSGPLSDMEFIQKALVPMLESKDNKALDTKMQKMKNHVSNLPNSNMLT